MTFASMLLVALGAAVGAPIRYLAERWLPRGTGSVARGLLLVNVVGSFIAGLAVARLTGPMLTLVLVGFCGSLTTFSGFGLEVSQQLRERRGWMLTTLMMLVGTFGAFSVAYLLARP